MYSYSSLYSLVDTTVDNIDSAAVVADSIEWVVVDTADTFVVAVDTSPVDFVVADDRRGSRAREAAVAVVAAAVVASSDAWVRSS